MARYSINGRTLNHLRTANNVSLSDMADSLSVNTKQLRIIENADEAAVSGSKLEKIANVFGVSPFALGGEAAAPSIDMIDFRTTNNRPAKPSAALLEKINIAKSIQRELTTIYDDDKTIKNAVEYERFSIETDPNEFSSDIRKLLKLSWTSQIEKEKPTTFFSYLRTRIEQLGIHVVQFSYPVEDSRGFCLNAEEYGLDVIGINRTLASYGSRNFTLIHELVHLLLDFNLQGISDYTKQKNYIERYCNHVAACALLPETQFSNWVQSIDKNGNFSRETLRYLSKTCEISQYSIAIRLEELGLAKPGFVENWKRSLPPAARLSFQAGNLDPIDGEKQIRRSGPATQRLSIIGTSLSSIALAAAEKGVRSDIDIFRSFGIKPDQKNDLRKAVAKRIQQVSDFG